VYLGQSVSPSGLLLATGGTKAATGIEIAKGDDALAAAAKAANVTASRIRDGLVVTAVQSPLATQLQSPPAVLKVSVTDRSAEVADAAAAAIAEHLTDATNEDSEKKIESSESRIATLKAQEKDLTVQRAAALRAVRSASPAERPVLTLLAGTIEDGLAAVQADRASGQTELGLASDFEHSRVRDTTKAAKVTSGSGLGGILAAAFFGAIVGLVVAFVLARLRSPRAV
jgi:hypothetical protein